MGCKKIGNYNTIVFDIDPNTYTADVSFNEVLDMVKNGITVQFRIIVKLELDGIYSFESAFVRSMYKSPDEINILFTTFTGYVDTAIYTDPDEPIVFSGF